jgi:hypothetical protein
MATKKQTAFVVVQREWFNQAIQPLTDNESHSEIDAHVMIGTVDDLTDLKGLWLRDVPSRYLKKGSNSFITMRLMIPWQSVLSLGLVDESPTLPVGFNNVTVLKADKPS